MDTTIIAALISAGASVFVALMGLMSERRKESKSSKNSIDLDNIPKKNNKIWFYVGSLSLIWIILAALFLHWDLAGMSGIFIPIVALILSVLYPIRSSSAVATTLFLFPFAFAAEPIGKWKRGMIFDNHFDADVLLFYIGFAFVTSLVVWLVTSWRIKSLYSVTHSKNMEPALGVLSKELSELAELHRGKVLTDEEFALAKSKLLSK